MGAVVSSCCTSRNNGADVDGSDSSDDAYESQSDSSATTTRSATVPVLSPPAVSSVVHRDDHVAATALPSHSALHEDDAVRNPLTVPQAVATGGRGARVAHRTPLASPSDDLFAFHTDDVASQRRGATVGAVDMFDANGQFDDVHHSSSHPQMLTLRGHDEEQQQLVDVANRRRSSASRPPSGSTSNLQSRSALDNATKTTTTTPHAQHCIATESTIKNSSISLDTMRTNATATFAPTEDSAVLSPASVASTQPEGDAANLSPMPSTTVTMIPTVARQGAPTLSPGGHTASMFERQPAVITNTEDRPRALAEQTIVVASRHRPQNPLSGESESFIGNVSSPLRSPTEANRLDSLPRDGTTWGAVAGHLPQLEVEVSGRGGNANAYPPTALNSGVGSHRHMTTSTSDRSSLRRQGNSSRGASNQFGEVDDHGSASNNNTHHLSSAGSNDGSSGSAATWWSSRDSSPHSSASSISSVLSGGGASEPTRVRRRHHRTSSREGGESEGSQVRRASRPHRSSNATGSAAGAAMHAADFVPDDSNANVSFAVSPNAAAVANVVLREEVERCVGHDSALLTILSQGSLQKHLAPPGGNARPQASSPNSGRDVPFPAPPAVGAVASASSGIAATPQSLSQNAASSGSATQRSAGTPSVIGSLQSQQRAYPHSLEVADDRRQSSLQASSLVSTGASGLVVVPSGGGGNGSMWSSEGTPALQTPSGYLRGGHSGSGVPRSPGVAGGASSISSQSHGHSFGGNVLTSFQSGGGGSTNGNGAASPSYASDPQLFPSSGAPTVTGRTSSWGLAASGLESTSEYLLGGDDGEQSGPLLRMHWTNSLILKMAQGSTAGTSLPVSGMTTPLAY